jgi:hypothetical protein
VSDQALDRLAAALGLGPSASPVLEALDALYAALDRDLAERSAGLDLPCRAGCDACCHEAVFVSAPEFLAVIRELRRGGRDLRPLIVAMRQIADRYEDELELLEELPPGAERDEVAARVKFRCPLLSSDGRCSVYASRELNARTFGQSYDATGGAPYGCGLTHERLRVLGQSVAERLYDAREARGRLMRAVLGTERVHVYPWWFKRMEEMLGEF